MDGEKTRTRNSQRDSTLPPRTFPTEPAESLQRAKINNLNTSKSENAVPKNKMKSLKEIDTPEFLSSETSFGQLDKIYIFCISSKVTESLMKKKNTKTE